jgi:DNA (cytosine-5)-methyltransferase 1
MSRPRLLDLFSGAGGASMGYHRAGFEVVGVDKNPQPRYPFEFVQADALEYLAEHWHEFGAVGASPPCQRYCPLNALPSTKDSAEHPDLVAPTREALQATGLPYVIENVMAAPLDKSISIRLCGGMFGLRTYRHRRFEPGGGLRLIQPHHPDHVIRTATKRRRELWAQGWHVSITGDVGTYVGPEAMGIDWMSGNELCEAIPPVYTELIGAQLRAHLGQVAAA